MSAGQSVHFDVPRERAFDYLADPHNRPAWQSSLARVEGVTGEPRVGQRWIDVTKPRLRPRMETTALERPVRWTEAGTWRGFRAVLTLEFTESTGGCDVRATMRLDAPGVLAPVAALLDRFAPAAVASDLRRAAKILREEH
ncbi:SRPBCC family protein [Nocardioides taihuensis]|uniref:SRPBCC family protein n=1 Tax=Nocardioides taihuensis TaxID=1835606 RepID=A0ABW0BLA7_9ACTN